MPRGKKTCPKCNAEHGPRTHKCDCGHEFFKASVLASTEPMSMEHKEVISTVKSVVSQIEARNKGSVPSVPPISSEPRRTSVVAASPSPVQAPQPVYRPGGRNIFTPAGACPVKPQGFKSDKWEEPFTDDTVREWATELYHSGPPYLPEAVVYFARFFWDINGPDFKKVRSLILETLIPKRKDYEPEEDELALTD